ncbi:MAG: hypothetical protein HC929_07010 [Leptolyngbyaceae cyanobacterium SM2_5_2]|nr:hypothetical protein [Leptolyngbyaceae cyanobacterium SM2_5_2]
MRLFSLIKLANSLVSSQMEPVQTSLPKSLTKASRAEQERIEEVLLLLENLFQREDAVAKSVIDCLYEVGAVRLIDQRVPLKILQWPLKGFAYYSKPLFRRFAVRWVKRNAPWMITCWLFEQVKFEGEPLPFEADSSPAIDVALVQEPLPALPPVNPLLERQSQEINALRSRVSWLTGAVVILVVFGCLNLLH